MKHLKGFRFFIMSALLFVFLAVGVSAYEYPVSPYDDWDVVSTDAIITGNSADKLRVSYYNSSISLLQSFEVHGPTQIAQSASSSMSVARGNYWIDSGATTMTEGLTYRIQGYLSDLNFCSTACSVTTFQVNGIEFMSGNNSNILYKNIEISDDDLYFDLVFIAPETSVVEVFFRLDRSSSVSMRTCNISFYGNTLQQISEPVQAEKTIEEWLQDIFNTIQSGITGEGQEPPTSPGLTEDVGTAGEHQTVIEDIEQGVLSDFDASYEALDIGNFSLPIGVINALAWINYTWTGFFNMAGDLQYIVFVPCLVGLFLLIIGRGAMAMRSAMPRGRAPRPKEVEIKGGDDD